MFKKKLFLFLLLVCAMEIYAQNRAKPGTMLIADKPGTDAINFVRDSTFLGNVTKYNIYNGEGEEIYEVDFKYNIEKDSILIAFYDKKNITAQSKRMGSIVSDPNSLICNYKLNSAVDTAKRDYEILFGINNRNFITLYQFKAVGLQTEFVLEKVKKNIYEGYNQTLVSKRHIDSLKQTRDSLADLLQRQMIKYRDDHIKELKKRKDTIELTGAAAYPGAAMQENFTKKMDSIFINYFKNIHSFNEEHYDIRVAFRCNGKGTTIDSTLIFSFISGIENSWMKDSLNRVIKPEIETEVFKTRTTPDNNPNIRLDFDRWYGQKFDDYKLDDSTKFLELKKKIDDTLNTYKTRRINSPTQYDYDFGYILTGETVNWKYEIADDGTDKFSDKTPSNTEITDGLKATFRKKFASQGKGKYQLKIWRLFINNGKKNAFEADDIQLIQKK